jgi:GDP-4-dehydro-6-deoxy-D-mannose reductase
VAALAAQDVTTYGLDRVVPRAEVRAQLADFVAGNVTDFEFLKKAIEVTRPDVVFHLAALTFGKPATPLDRDFFTINVDGTRWLLEAILGHGLETRVLITGSSAAYGRTPGRDPIDENAPLRPQTLYAASKVCQELIALTYHRTHALPVIVTRAFNHTGPGEHPHFALSSFARQIAEIEAGVTEPPMRVGNLESYRDFSDVRDVVRGYIAAAFDGRPGECYNVCSGVAHQLGDTLAGLIELSGRSIASAVDPSRLQASDVPYQRGSAAKLRAHTGWQPAIPFHQTLVDLLDHWRREVAQGGAIDSPGP